MNRPFLPLLPCVVISFCLAACPMVLAAEGMSPGGNSNRELVVRLVDVDGKPIEGAHVGRSATLPIDQAVADDADESGWRYEPHAVTDGNGLARILEEEEIPLVCLVARHVGRKLVAIQSVTPEQLKGTITVTMRPQCRVFGRLVSKELEARNRKITWSIVNLYADGKRPLEFQSKQADFHFYVPPGTYKLRAYSAETHEVERTVTVQPGQQELEIEPIDMPATRLVLLEGQPAPELRDIVGWKNSGPLELANLRGKVVILQFWAYWCGPCVTRMPRLFADYDKYRDQGLVVIGIHVDADDGIDSAAKLDEKLAEVKHRVWKDRDIPFPVALVLRHRVPHQADVQAKASCALAAEYGITGYPTGLLINRLGSVVGEFSAGAKSDEAILEKVLKEK